MDNDLISRSALKANIPELDSYDNGSYVWLKRVDVDNLIDNAPTVDTYTIEDIQEVRENALILGAKLAQRPQGEWIAQEGYDGDEYYECSVCKDAFMLMEGTPKENNYNYCPNCGADMQKGGADMRKGEKE